MSIQITIIGMGQIGTSIGLALATHKDLVYRVGHDKNIGIANHAKKIGAVERVDINLPNAVEQARLVVLALPLDQVRETLQVIAPCLQEEAVVMDTTPVKESVAGWAKELLPEKRYYVGLVPVLNPDLLQSHETGTDAAHADLFKGGMMGIISPPGVPSEAIKLATDLSRLLGAEHLFVDLVEADSLMASTHILPQLIATALVNVTIDQPGWREARKVAGRSYAEVTGPGAQFEEPAALASEALSSRQHITRLLDSLIATLSQMRNEIRDGKDDQLLQRLARARQGRELWWKQRQRGDWAFEESAPPMEIPTAKEVLGRLIGMGRKPKSEDDKTRQSNYKP